VDVECGEAAMPDTGDERDWLGRELIDRDGDAIGLIRSVDLDDAGEPAWVRVEIGGSGETTGVVPLAAATLDGPVVRVPYDRALILAAPTIQGPLSSSEGALLAEHYGLDEPATLAPDERARRDYSDTEATGDVGDIGDF
jgi:hypothetical protein